MIIISLEAQPRRVQSLQHVVRQVELHISCVAAYVDHPPPRVCHRVCAVPDRVVRDVHAVDVLQPKNRPRSSIKAIVFNP